MMKQQKADLRSRVEQLYDSSDDSTIHSGSPILLDIVSRLIDVQQQIVSIKENQDKFDTEVNSIKKDIVSISNTLTTPTVNHDGIAGTNSRGPVLAEQFPHTPREYIPSPYWPQVFAADPSRRQMYNGISPLMLYSPSYPYPAPHYPPEMHHQVPPPSETSVKMPSKSVSAPHKTSTTPTLRMQNYTTLRPSSSKHSPKVHIVQVPSRSNTGRRFGKRPYRPSRSPKPSLQAAKKARREKEEVVVEEERDLEEDDDDSPISCLSSADEEAMFSSSKDRESDQTKESENQGHKHNSYKPKLSPIESLDTKGKEKDTGEKRPSEQPSSSLVDAHNSSVPMLDEKTSHALEQVAESSSSKKQGRQTLNSKESLTYGDFFALASTQESYKDSTSAFSSTHTPLPNSANYPIDLSSPVNSPSVMDALSPPNDALLSSYNSGTETDSEDELSSFPVHQTQEPSAKPVFSAIHQEALDAKPNDAADFHRRMSVANEKGIRSNGTWEINPICKMTKINTRKDHKKKPGSKILNRPPRVLKGSISPGLSHLSGTDSEEETQSLGIGVESPVITHNTISNIASNIASNTIQNTILHEKMDQNSKSEYELELTPEEIQASEGSFLKKETEKSPLFKLTLRERFERKLKEQNRKKTLGFQPIT
ncbi:hypothetical protein BY458DRAFT_547444 [Sporodiniella umbellata]|nr:hypothetical protein BY458DRAFT_547444 [Sporodiniella umbellata]